MREREVESEQHQKRNGERERSWGKESLEAKQQQRDSERDGEGK